MLFTGEALFEVADAFGIPCNQPTDGSGTKESGGLGDLSQCAFNSLFVLPPHPLKGMTYVLRWLCSLEGGQQNRKRGHFACEGIRLTHR